MNSFVIYVRMLQIIWSQQHEVRIFTVGIVAKRYNNVFSLYLPDF